MTQSFNFLLSVAEFKNTVDASISESKAVGTDFDKYIAIVQEYIESGACSEVRDGQKGAHGGYFTHSLLLSICIARCFTFIVTNSLQCQPFRQVNIDDHARHQAVLYTEQHDFISLSLVRKRIRRERLENVRIVGGEGGHGGGWTKYAR